MGTDLHFRAEWQRLDGTWGEIPLPEPQYPWRTDLRLLFGWPSTPGYWWKLPPIVEPRGLPEDVSWSVKQDASRCGGNHRHSHVTMKELLLFDWYQEVLPANTIHGEPAMLCIDVMDTMWLFGVLETLMGYGDSEHVRLIYWLNG